MIENILKSVTEAEAKAEAIIRQAEQNGAEIVNEAKKQAEYMKVSTGNSLKIKQQELTKQLQTASAKQLEENLKNVKQEAKTLKESAWMKKKTAIEAVIAQIV